MKSLGRRWNSDRGETTPVLGTHVHEDGETNGKRERKIALKGHTLLVYWKQEAQSVCNCEGRRNQICLFVQINGNDPNLSDTGCKTKKKNLPHSHACHMPLTQSYVKANKI